MFDMTLRAAERWYDIFNILLIVGAFVVAVATYGSIKMGSIKERFADERITANEAESARAAADSDIAKAQAAQANERAAEANLKAEVERVARLELEARLAPRTLTGVQLQSISSKISPFAPQPFRFTSYQDDQEVRGLVEALIHVLVASGWKGVPATDFLMASLVLGVTVEFAPAKEHDFGPAARTLASALHSEGIAATAQVNPDLSSTPEQIRVKVGKKP
jgi:hypothetical protein